MTPSELAEPRYVQTEVLWVTRLRAATLQTWLNRSIMTLAEQNPGYGRRRLYSAVDIVRLAVMRRIADLHIDLSVGAKLADACAKQLLDGKEIEWNLHLTFRPAEETDSIPVTLLTSSESAFAPYGPMHGDAWELRVSQFTEPDTSIFRRRYKPSLPEMLKAKENGQELNYEERPIIPEAREALARRGIHAEPAIIFPIGEIVNGTLAQLRAFLKAEQPPDRNEANPRQ